MIDRVGISCTGCGSCEARCPFGAIGFKTDTNGFTYPHIDVERCTKCNLCERSCPVSNELTTESNDSITTYAAFATEKPSQSSSGGSFYSIAHAVLSNGGVVYGAYLTTDLNVIHIRVDNKESLYKLCGSKYVQSLISPDLYKSIETDLKNEKQVLFIGTPCQVAGVKLFLRRNYENFYTIDLICHGVPSPKVFSDFINYCKKLRRHKITGFIFRDNRDGWNNIFKSTIKYEDSIQEYNTGLSNLWNRLFFSELITRPSCHECRFATTQRVGDLTLGDFWGIKNVPVAIHNKGVSLILCNTHKGRELLSISPLTLIESKTNRTEHPNLYNPTPMNPDKADFQDYYNANGFSKAVKRYFGFSKWLDFKLRLYSILSKIRQK